MAKPIYARISTDLAQLGLKIEIAPGYKFICIDSDNCPLKEFDLKSEAEAYFRDIYADELYAQIEEESKKF